MAKELKRVKGKEFFNYKKRLCDRKDGWKVVNRDNPYFQIMSHIMPERCDAQCFFEEYIETEALDNFVRKVRRDPSYGMPDLSRLAVVMAAVVRAYARYPKINRFVANRQVYSRRNFTISLTLKRKMHVDSGEETIKPEFYPNQTLKDVYDQLYSKLSVVKDVENNTSKAVGLLCNLPQWLLRLVFAYVHAADNHKGIPKWLYDLSPFHTSVYLTDIGSTGISSIYHHIYNFGSTSCFIAMGRREKKLVLDDNGNPKYVNTMKFSYVIDERIVDGFYWAKTVRYIDHLLTHPEQLLDPPEVINEDLLS